MSAVAAKGRPGIGALRGATWRDLLGDVLPGIALVAMFAACVAVQPASFSQNGLNLLFSPAIPLVLAAISQMFIIVLGDIDLGTGYLVGLANVVAARYLASEPLLAIGIFALIVVGYLIAGALVQLRGIPALVVTLGASFVWLGFAMILLPTPGGSSPLWLQQALSLNVPVIPYPLLVAGVIAIVAYLLTVRMPYGSVMRGAGSNALAVQRNGWSLLMVRLTCYGLAAVFGILSGLAVTGITSSGDSNASANYTLLAIAAVILGGGAFSGGRAVPVGAVIGALAMSLVGSLLGLVNISSNWQTGAQGMILILVLAGRALTRRSRA